MSGSSNLDSFRDRWQAAVQVLLCGFVPPWLVQYCSQHPCVATVKLFFFCLVWVHVVHPYSSIDTTAAWKKLRLIISVRSEFHMTDSLSMVVHAFAFASRVSQCMKYETFYSKFLLSGGHEKDDCIWKAGGISLLPYSTMSNKIKLADHRRGWPKATIFNSYYTELLGRALLLSLDCSTLPLIGTL